MKILLSKIKDLEKLKSWGKFLDGNQEAVDTLEHENIAHESVYSFQIDGKDYCISITIPKGKIRKADMNVDLNVQHKKVMKSCMSERIIPEKIYSLDNDK